MYLRYRYLPEQPYHFAVQGAVTVEQRVDARALSTCAQAPPKCLRHHNIKRVGLENDSVVVCHVEHMSAHEVAPS